VQDEEVEDAVRVGDDACRSKRCDYTTSGEARAQNRVSFNGGHVKVTSDDEGFAVGTDGISKGRKVGMILGRVVSITVIGCNSNGAKLGGMDRSYSCAARDRGREVGGGEGEGEGDPNTSFVRFRSAQSGGVEEAELFAGCSKNSTGVGG
jgi:hypothetical protein